MHLSAFIRQKSYEQVNYTLRRHPFTFLPTVLIFLIALVLPAILSVFIGRLFPNLLGSGPARSVAVLFASGYIVSVLLFFYTQFIDFYLDIWIITNDRLIAVDQTGLFSRQIAETDLFQIQDATTTVTGLFATFFNYGNVQVQTASSNEGIILRDVRNPNFIREELIRLAREDRKFHIKELTPVDNNPTPMINPV